MLNDSNAFGGFAVDDLAKAKQFYTQVLGVNVEETDMGVLRLKFKDGGHVIVYPKPDFTPATFTVLSFPVDNIEAIMAQLRAKGVAFEVYKDGPAPTDDNGVSSYKDTKAAWFKDPAGNILALLQGM